MHCDDFSRTDAERRSRLEAPISRRRLLQAGLGATISLYAARAMPLTRAFEAAEASAQAAPNAPVLVNVFVPGGLDLLDTLVPGDAYARYADLRPALKVAQPIALAGTGFGMHPALGEGLNGGLKGLFDRGHLGFIPGIDYANPDLSHFNSRHFWETGLISINPAPGWLARWTDRHGGADNPFQALSMDAGLSPLLRGSHNPVAAVQSPDDAQSWVPGVWGEWQDRMMEHYAAIAAQRPHGSGAAAVFAAARQSQLVARTLKPYVKDPKTGADPLAPPVAYPGGENGEGTNGFAENLRYLAGLLALPLGIRVATVDAPGDFDTHDDQAATLVRDLAQLSQGLSAFQADLEARGVADRVLTLVWTEFGRRPAGELLGRDRPRRRRHRLGHGDPGARRPALALPGPQRLRQGRQPQGHHRLPRGLREPARAVAGHRRRRGAARRRPRGARRARRMSALIAAVVLAAAGATTPVGLGMREYRFSVYRSSVHAGAVAFNMTNFGEDAHNLRVSGPGGYRSAVSRDVKPGGHLRFTVHLLRAGTYRLVCLKPGHAALGMKATLRVTRRR